MTLTSVGAGALGSVMLLYLYPLRMTPHRLVATDLVRAIPLAVVAGMGYLFAGLGHVAKPPGWLDSGHYCGHSPCPQDICEMDPDCFGDSLDLGRLEDACSA